MAKLEDLMPDLNNELVKSHHSANKRKQTVDVIYTPKKRRAWLEDVDADLQPQNSPLNKKEVSPPLAKGGIKPLLTTPLINPINTPLSEKGSMKEGNTPLLISLQQLRSNPLKLVMFLFSRTEGKKNSNKTNRVTMREITQSIEITKDSGRTALRFLLKRGGVSRAEFKVGKMGYSVYEIEKTVYEDIRLGIKKGVITPFEMHQNSAFQKGSNSSNSYSNTTIKEDDLLNWESIDVSALEEIGFTKKYLLQLKNITTPELVQESIEHFSFALKNNESVKKYNNPIAAFMKTMKRGEAWIEPKYESPKEKALREFVERQKLQKAKREEMINDLLEIEFAEWKSNLTEKEVKNIVPPDRFRLQAAKISALSEYYKNEILIPRLKKEGLL